MDTNDAHSSQVQHVLYRDHYTLHMSHSVDISQSWEAIHPMFIYIVMECDVGLLVKHFQVGLVTA